MSSISSTTNWLYFEIYSFCLTSLNVADGVKAGKAVFSSSQPSFLFRMKFLIVEISFSSLLSFVAVIIAGKLLSFTYLNFLNTETTISLFFTSLCIIFFLCFHYYFFNKLFLIRFRHKKNMQFMQKKSIKEINGRNIKGYCACFYKGIII